MFEKFKKALKKYVNKDFNQVQGQPLNNLKEFKPTKYLQFLKEIGFGEFFGGDLILVEPHSKDYLALISNFSGNSNFNSFFPIGMDGTNEGAFCLKNTADSPVYWIDYYDNEPIVISEDFEKWVESFPKEYLNADYRRAYGKPKFLQKIKGIELERKKFTVEIFKYDLKLCNEPGQTEMLYLKRYNKIIFKVSKISSSDLKFLTFIIYRKGSEYGLDNIEYCTLDVSNLNERETRKIESFVFDPYNRPFKSLEPIFNPEIDLSTNQRVRFKEIIDLL